MTRSIFSTVTFFVTVAVSFFVFFFLPFPVTSLGSGSTYAVVYGSDTICALISGQPTQRMLCYDTRRRINVTLNPGVSFSSIAVGENFLCGIRSGGYSRLCWDNIGSYSFNRKRIYQNDTVLVEHLSVGDRQICATVNGTNSLKCWRDDPSTPPNDGFGSSAVYVLVVCWGGGAERFNTVTGSISFESISSGLGLICGLISSNFSVMCWNPISSVLALVRSVAHVRSNSKTTQFLDLRKASSLS